MKKTTVYIPTDLEFLDLPKIQSELKDSEMVRYITSNGDYYLTKEGFVDTDGLEIPKPKDYLDKKEGYFFTPDEMVEFLNRLRTILVTEPRNNFNKLIKEL